MSDEDTEKARATIRARVVAKIEKAFKRLFIRSVDEPEPIYKMYDETDEQFRERVMKALKDRSP
jgi:hypothetical protein